MVYTKEQAFMDLLGRVDKLEGRIQNLEEGEIDRSSHNGTCENVEGLAKPTEQDPLVKVDGTCEKGMVLSDEQFAKEVAYAKEKESK